MPERLVTLAAKTEVGWGSVHAKAPVTKRAPVSEIARSKWHATHPPVMSVRAGQTDIRSRRHVEWIPIRQLRAGLPPRRIKMHLTRPDPPQRFPPDAGGVLAGAAVSGERPLTV